LAACGQPNSKSAGGTSHPGSGLAGGRGPSVQKGGVPPAPGRGILEADPATLLARSNLPGLIKSQLSFFVSVAELDPRNIVSFAEGLRDQLCKAGRCPTYVVFKDHSHISEVMSPNTPDTSVTGPILDWMKSIR
jgi:hypothetical protein